MKKIVGIIAAAALAASAFAEVNIGLGANQAFAPVAYDGDDIVTVGPVANWDGLNNKNVGNGLSTGRVGLSFSAESENAGVVTDFHIENNEFDNAYGWVKPFSFLEIKAGKIDTNWRRLGFGYGVWNTLRPSAMDTAGDDLAFYRPHRPNFALLLTPIEGLEIVYDYVADDSTDDDKIEDHEIYDELWNHARYGASYTIDGVGTIMAQLYGQRSAYNKDYDKKDWGVVGVAFELTGIENLYAQFGVQAPTTFAPLGNKEGEEIGNSNIKLGAGVSYTLDALTLHAYFNGAIKANDDGDYGDFGFALGAGVDYALSDAYTLLADVRFINDKMIGDGDEENHVILFGGLEHHLTNATLKLGFVGETKSTVRGHLTDSGKLQDFTFGIPVVLDINF